MNGTNVVTIVEVGPRDGLQNIAQLVPTDEKVRIVDLIAESGVPRIEVTAFVHPKWVPQLADSAELFSRIHQRPGVAYTALVPNARGLERAIEHGVKEVQFVICATDSMNRENQNKSTAETVAELPGMAQTAADNGVTLNGIVAVGFGCPYEGEVPIEKVYRVVEAFQNAGSPIISIADSTGIAQPEQVKDVFQSLHRQFPDVNFSVHLHDLGIGLVNAYAAYEAGIRTFEGCVAGLGGCPYAADPGGNIATEGLVNMFHRMGVATGIDLPRLTQAGQYVRKVVGECPEKQHGRPDSA